MDKIAEIFQSRSKKASYLTSNGEELLKHLITGGCVNTQEGSRLVCGLWACSHWGEKRILLLGYGVRILEDINWVVSMNVCAIFTAILWESFGFSQARQYFQHEVVHAFHDKMQI